MFLMDSSNAGVFRDKNREVLKRLRLRNVFVTQLRESVIGTDEEVVAGYAAFTVERRTMADHGNGKTVPFGLCVVTETLPGIDGPMMYLELVELVWSTGKVRTGTLLPEAYSVTVEECDIACRRPAVGESGIWIVSWHSA